MKTAMDHILDILNMPPRFNSVCVTSEGCYLGQLRDNASANVWMGKPSFHEGPGRARSLQVWNDLTLGEQCEVLHLAASPPDGQPIPILRFPGFEMSPSYLTTSSALSTPYILFKATHKKGIQS